MNRVTLCTALFVFALVCCVLVPADAQGYRPGGWNNNFGPPWGGGGGGGGWGGGGGYGRCRCRRYCRRWERWSGRCRGGYGGGFGGHRGGFGGHGGGWGRRSICCRRRRQHW